MAISTTARSIAGRSKKSATKKKKGFSTSEKSQIMFGIAVFVLVLALIAKFYFTRIVPHKTNPINFTTEPVARMRLSNDDNHRYGELAERRIPLLLTNTVADQWLARQKFTTKYLSKAIDYVTVHKQKSQRSFKTFHDNKPLEPLVAPQWDDFNLKYNITVYKLLLWGRPPMPYKGPYYYYSQDLQQLRYAMHCHTLLSTWHYHCLRQCIGLYYKPEPIHGAYAITQYMHYNMPICKYKPLIQYYKSVYSVSMSVYCNSLSSLKQQNPNIALNYYS